jgi:hypothetical protein
LDIPRALDRRGEIPISRPKDEGKKGQKESPEKPEVKIEIDPTPKGEWKVLGGGDRDQWNERLSALVTGVP